MTAAVVSVSFLAVGLLGYIVGRLHARAVQKDARGGMIDLRVYAPWHPDEFLRVPGEPPYDHEKHPLGDAIERHLTPADDDPGVQSAAALYAAWKPGKASEL